jgi:hypothetical protein
MQPDTSSQFFWVINPQTFVLLFFSLCAFFTFSLMGVSNILMAAGKFISLRFYLK